MGNIQYSFEGRTAVVTGAARGIGLELVRFFHSAGARTYGIDLADSPLDDLRVEGVVAIAADVSDTESVTAAVSTIVADSGRVDVLVNNAGILRDSVVWKMTDDQWNSVMSVHAGGTFKMTRACIPHFREQSYGRIINLTSYAGLHGNLGQANYSTAKAGIIGLTKTTARELARFGVTVNAVSPNAVTRMLDSIPEDRLAAIAAQIPAGRFSEPSEICAGVGFLASEEAAYVTGVVLNIDGGLAM